MATEETTAEKAPANIKPHHLVIGLGAAIALFTATSGVVPLITEWHDDSHVQRHVFGNIPRHAGQELGAGHARQPSHHTSERQASPGGLPFRRLHADAAARSRRRASCTRSCTSRS
jgi:hypothetical protein